MKIGSYTVDSVETGTLWLDGGAMFGVVPKILWSKLHPADASNRIELAMRSLLIRGDGRTVLVDTGAGHHLSEKQAARYGLDNSRHELLSSLAALGVAPGQVTDVLLTHLHFDHTGGSTVVDGGVLKPAFPSAKYYVQKAHWDYAQRPTERDRASFLPEMYIPLSKHGVLVLVEGETEILPGISVVVVDGHTTAQQLPKISDGQTTLLFGGDMLALASHVRLPYIQGYDLRPLVTLEEKRAILGRACRERWTLFFQHDPQVVTARVRESEKGFVLEAPGDA